MFKKNQHTIIDDDLEMNKELYIKYGISQKLSYELRKERLIEAKKSQEKEEFEIKTNISGKTKAEIIYEMISNGLMHTSPMDVMYYDYIENCVELYNDMVEKGIIIEKKESD